MIPILSRLSVSLGIDDCFRLRCSSRYLRISPLHREFHHPPPDSSLAVSNADPRLSRGFLHSTYQAAYTPFTPSNSEQRSPLTYYRGCWHVISRGLFLRYRHQHTISCMPYSSLKKEVYNPKTFFPHAASLRQGFPHCGRFLAAASRRSRDRVSVPLWLTILSDQLPVLGLVGLYPANYLMGRRLIKRCGFNPALPLPVHQVLPQVSLGYPWPYGRFLRFTHPSASRRHPYCYGLAADRLACLKHAASVRSEPESNPP